MTQTDGHAPSVLSPNRPRTLILLAKAPNPSIPEDVRVGDIPRVEYLELARAIGAEILDFHSVAASDHPLVKAARREGPLWGLAALGALRRREFDHIYATGEDIGMRLATMLHATGWYGRVTVVIHHGGTPKRKMILRLLGHSVWRNVICLSASQWRILTEDVGLPAHKVHRFDQWIDHLFYRPEEGAVSEAAIAACEYALSCGRESRDYPTLQRAADGLPYRFRVVASGWAPHAGFDPATGVATTSNVSVEKEGLSYRALRDLYARARFVVAPINNVPYAAAVTSICEGMAMGKAIIASASPGIIDYVKHGVSGLLVPVGDAEALRRAVRELWEDPARCAEMGRHNRRWAEEILSTDHYVSRVAGLFGIDHRPAGAAAGS